MGSSVSVVDAPAFLRPSGSAVPVRSSAGSAAPRTNRVLVVSPAVNGHVARYVHRPSSSPVPKGALVLGLLGLLGLEDRPRSARTKQRVRHVSAALSAGEYGLPPKLAAMASALSALPNDRMRYQQLMALAGKLKAMPDDLKVPENKVPGCLSVVHVSASLEEDGTVTFQGDSDALISKGLVALLVLCLSGCTPQEIASVKPEFIKASGISAALTPGRNNGFFNMFKLMNQKVAMLASPKEETEVEALQIYNTLSRKKELFKTLEPGVVKMYVCGVTVYDLCHLGHARVMVFFDIVARFLRHRGYKVTFVRNVTDIDDKIIKRSQEAGVTAQDLARRMEEEMALDAQSLGCTPPDFEPRVSESMEEITEMVDTLVKEDFAYAGKGDVYFRVRRFESYGRLSRCSLDGNEAGARVEVADVKEAPEDFVLWKSAKPSEPSWPSPWGPGRPGWHIECSAMAKKYLGTTLDIHGGGPDLVFPHHENEIAQSEAANGETYVKTWMHCAAVRSTGNEKMSKSLGNFVTIRDVLKKYDGEVVRFYLLSSQYRRPMLYSEEALAEAQDRLLKLYSSLRGAGGCEKPADCEQAQRFEAAMANDFDTVNAVAALIDLSKELLQLRQGDHGAEFQGKARQLRNLGAVLGILQRNPEEVCKGPVDDGFEEKVESLIQARADARKAKDFGKADAIREELTSMGVIIEDGAQGTSWRVASLV
ncbi:unnamed protein product [Durusdinium trenchii]|uniref:Cysteine--tRNA ligase n=1 Tax=Durusdinium trenchii TaxID=1381693 RepID=A0ABP0IHN6_9DINO